MKNFVFILIISFFFCCGHTVSKELREGVDKAITPTDLFKDPDTLKGKTVMLGGVIASSINTPEGTYVEVVQKPLDYRERPEDTDISYGRFLILYDGYLDTAIYSMGREITVVGEVLGRKLQPLGEIQYPYLLIKSKELYLFEPRRGIPIRFGIGVWHTF